MDWLEIRPKKKHGLVTLQLAPLIDIVVLIIVFLVKGTVLGGTTVQIPPGFDAARSKSIENMDIAPQVILTKKTIIFEMLSKEIPLDVLKLNGYKDLQLEEALRHYMEALAPEQKTSGILVNLVADRNSSYENVFDLTQFLRRVGFESILYVAEGEK